MSRVLIISSNVAVDPYPVYPLGMAVVSGALQEAGHEVLQYDCLGHGLNGSLLEERIRNFAPDLIAISLRNVDSVNSFSSEDEGWYLSQTRELVNRLRHCSGVPIVVGGPALTVMPEAIATYLDIDHAVIGEGERRFPELVAMLERGEIPSRLIGRGLPVKGEDFGAPLYQQDLVDYYLRHSGLLNLQTKRGCPYRCSYCSYPHLEGTKLRVRPPRQVVAELKRLKEEHGVADVFFTDSIFNDPQGHYLELVEELLRAELDLRWSAFFRPQGLGVAELALMKRAGLFALELGTDAAADQTLAGIEKGLTFAEVMDVNRACQEVKLPAAHYVMFGGPNETPSSLEEGLDNLKQLQGSVVFAFSGIRIFPDTPLFRRAVADGVIAAEASLLKPVYYFSPHIDRNAMEDRIQADFSRQHNRLFPPSEAQVRMEVMKRFGFVGLLWDRMVRFPKEPKSVV